MAQIVELMATIGSGLIVMVKFCAAPVQPFWDGVTTRLPTIGVDPVLMPVKLIFPIPDAPSPIAVLELTQLKVAPFVPLKLATTAVPAQALWLAGAITLGAGLTVIVKFSVAPVQPAKEGVTAKLARVGVPTLAAVKLMSPIPEAPSPIAVFVFVQSKVAPAVPLNVTATIVPAHTV